MGVVDRYVVGLFLRIFSICFVSLTGLYVVIDVFANLEEFLGYATSHGGLVAVLSSYYGARVLTFFDTVCGLLALTASILTIAWLQRTREITALMASGIPVSRIVRPLIGCSLLVAAVATVSRETVIPKYRDVLSRNAQDWLGAAEKPVQARHDHHVGVLIGGKSCRADRQQIDQFSLLFHRPVPGIGRRVAAGMAVHEPATADHPAGFRLAAITRPAGLADQPDVRLATGASGGGGVIVYTAKSHSWLRPGEAFLPTRVSFEHLAGNSVYLRHSSTWQLVETLRSAGLGYGAELRVMVHGRFVQPLLDGCLVFLGLPIVLSRRQKNIWWALAKCFGVVLVYYVVILVAGTLGGSYWVSPVTAAWLPVFLFIPTAFALNRFDG